MAANLILTDHYAWQQPHGGHSQYRYRVFDTANGARVLVTATHTSATTTQLTAPWGTAEHTDFQLRHPGPSDYIADLTHALTQLGTVRRYRTLDLWDALGTAILRQLVRADHARAKYQRLCQAHGEKVGIDTGDVYYMFPRPLDVLHLTEAQWREAGCAFNAKTLTAAAEAYRHCRSQWSQLPAADLIRNLKTIKGIGDWIARAAVADFFNDFAVYPYDDLAVRRWAAHAAPHQSWPIDEAATFAEVWRQHTGDALATFTLLTLAWGHHHGSQQS